MSLLTSLQTQYILAINDYWILFLCSFHHQVKVQQRCLFLDQPHKRSYFYQRQFLLAIRAIQDSTSSHIVYLDPAGKLIDRVNITGLNSTHISLRDDTIKCTDWKTNTIYNRLSSLSANTSLPSGNMSQPAIRIFPLSLV
jgi:hypothetical protein